ncbi:MAG: gliding motility-associated C-terminal domain-containing protein [Bacteroidetes bacterium]|nr:gliding motility-associated C-terminal domain-containing protein [Bacteroidota bacterium]
MKKIIFIALLVFVCNCATYAQALTCLTPTLVFTDPLNANAPVPSTLNCDFPGLVRIQSSPGLNGPLTQGNTPCIRLETALTNMNSATNNSIAIYQGTLNTSNICGTCPLSVTSNSLYTLYMPGLTPSLTHSYTLCHSAVAANFTYTFFSCYSNVILNSGTWNNASAPGCQSITIPANTAIGSASFVVSPAVPPAAIIQDFGSGYITLDPWQMGPGLYSITYNFNSQSGCTSTATRTLLITNPFVTGNSNFTPPPNLCPYGSCVNLLGAVTGYTSPNGYPLFSGTGVTTNSFCPATAGVGTFPVTYEVGPTAVCGRTVTNSVIVNALPAASAGPTASFTCNSPFTATLTGSGGPPYNWTGPNIISGNGTSSIVVGSTGNYSVVVTSAANCTAQSVASVVQNTTSPNVIANAVSNIITCTNPQAVVSVQPVSGATYSWTGPGISGSSTGSSINVTVGGNYNVVVTDPTNGCSTNSVTINAAQNKTVTNTPSTAGSVGCVASAISLSTTASGPYTWLWTAPAGSTLTSANNAQTATANSTSGGNFTITVNNQVNGCSSTSVIALNVNQTPPPANASNSGVVNCTNTAVNLTSTSSGVTYTWTAPAGSSVSSPGTANSGANGGGTYTLNITSTTNGCTNTAVTAVTTQTTKPTALISNTPVITCFNPTVTINGGPASGVTYNWSGGTISGASTNANVNVTSPAVYALAVTSTSNGCVSNPVNVTITQNNSTSTLTAASQTAASGCGSSSVVTLSGNANPAGSTYTWTSGGSFASGVNSSTVLANSATTYTLNATHPVSGCISSLVYTVVPSANQPTLTASTTNGTITCLNTTQSTTVTSNPPSNVTYTWTGPGIVGASNTNTVNTNLAGTYNLVVTNTVNGCSNSVSYIVSANNTPLTVSAPNKTVTCTNPSTNLTTTVTPASGSLSYTWSNGSTGTSSIMVSPTTNTIYVVNVFNSSNGCSGSKTITVIANKNPPSAVSVSPNNFTITCGTPTTVLTANATGATSYTWVNSGGSFISPTNQSTVAISGPGSYSAIATNSVNGCSAAAAVATITPDSNAPTFNISNSSPSITCNNAAPGVSVTVTSTVPIQSYSWSPTAGIAGATNSSVVTFTAPGNYTGVITATNGCSSNTIIVVTSATTAPVPVAGSATAQAISCTNPVVSISPVFSPSSNLTYAWSGPGIVGSNSGSSIQVNQSGTYSLIVTNTLTGCSTSSISVPVNGSNVVPSLSVTSSSSIGISCQPNTSTVSLNAQSSSTNASYSWNTGATTQNISTSTPGIYSVTITDNNTQCASLATIAVANNTTQPNLSVSSAGNLPCGAGGTTALTASSTNSNVSFTWTGNGIVSGSNTASAAVNQPGTFTVNAFNSITGCSATSTVSINQTTVNALATANATTGPAPLNVNFTNQSSGAATYSWSFGGGGSSTQSNPSNTFGSTGTYTVILYAINGTCSSSDTIFIKVLESLGAIPEVFTPNGDDKNDKFVIEGLDSYPNSSLQIFNRWGNPVYSAKPYKNDWDGSPNVSGKTGSGKLPTGTYFYLLELNDTDKQNFKGFIQIQY